MGQLLYFQMIMIFSFLFSFSSFAQEEDLKVLTFKKAINLALDVSLEIKNKTIETTMERAGQAKNLASALPRVSVAWNYNHFDEAIPFRNADGTPEVDESGNPIYIRPQNTSNGSVTITQPLTGLFTALGQAYVYKNSRLRAKLSLEKTLIDVSFLTAQGYREVQKAHAIYGITAERIGLAEKQKREAEVGFKLGKISKSDVLRLEVLVNQAKVNAAKMKSTFEATQGQFLSALNFSFEQQFSFEEVPDAAELNAQVNVPYLNDARLEALSNHAELKIVQLQLNELRQSSALPLLAAFPDVNAFLKVDHNFGQIGILAIPTTQTFGLALNWDLWNGGEPFFNYRINELQLSKARNHIVHTERQISLSVLKSRSDLVAAKETFFLQRSTLEQAKEVYKGIYERFRLGAVSVTDVLQAEDILNSAKIDLVSAMIDLDIQNMLLQKAIGKNRPDSIL